jgi:hypothetical protein
MSIDARQALVDSKQTIFQNDSQRTDLLNPDLTQTGLIAVLSELVAKGFYLLFTAVKSDHHDDSGLGEHCHFNGYCADLWPLHSSTATDYINADDPKFAVFLKVLASCRYHYQTGLAGSADTDACHEAAGPTCFSDSGADHIHVGAQNEP